MNFDLDLVLNLFSLDLVAQSNYIYLYHVTRVITIWQMFSTSFFLMLISLVFVHFQFLALVKKKLLLVFDDKESLIAAYL